MAGTHIVVDDKEVVEALSKLIAAIGNPEPALRNIGEHLRQTTIERFETETAPDGTPWKPLNPLYAATKKGRGILKESGELQREIVYQIAGSGASAELLVGTNRPHAWVHQEGAIIRPKNGQGLVFMLGARKVFARSVTIPARPYLGLSEADASETLMIVSEHLHRTGFPNSTEFGYETRLRNSKL